MLKKFLLLMSALLLLSACSALAEEDAALTLVITEDMRFYSGPGTHYTQSAYHNIPPQPGETAQIIGREGDWLLVCYTGHWFGTANPVWYYLPLSAAPEFAGAPELAFAAESNALAVESARVYADPERLTYDTYIHPDDSGLTVLELRGDMAYVDGVNPYGYQLRGFISVNDLAAVPGATALQSAPQDTAVLLSRTELPLTYAPASQYMSIARLPDGSLAMKYDTVLESGDWAVAVAFVSPEGELVKNPLHRKHDGTEESVIEMLLPGQDGFCILYATGDDLNPLTETYYTSKGEKDRIITLSQHPGDPRDHLGTPHFRILMGMPGYAEETGSDTTLLCVSALHNVGTTLMEIGCYDTVASAAEAGGWLIVPVSGEANGDLVTHLLLFDDRAQLVSETVIPGNVYDVQLVPDAMGGASLLVSLGAETWQGYTLAFPEGRIAPSGLTLSIPSNRRIALLSAKGGQVLLATGGVDTQMILTDGQEQLLAAETAGVLVYAASDGDTAALLLMQDGVLRTETYALCMP